MKKTIEKLRQKPKRDRQKIAFGSAFLMTLVIALVWLSVAVNRFDSSSQTAQIEGPISSLKDSISGFGR